MRVSGAPQRGHTLAEMLVVVLILGVVAALALPQAEPVNPLRADAAAGEVAQALRFAQSAAMRTGQYHLVRCDAAANSVTVSRLDINAAPPAPDPAFPVFHPIDKKDYKIVFSTAPSSAGVAIATCAFAYSDGKPAVPQLVFGADGAPVNVVGSGAGDVKALTGTGQVTLAAGRASRSVLVAAVTGRVTLAP